MGEAPWSCVGRHKVFARPYGIQGANNIYGRRCPRAPRSLAGVVGAPDSIVPAGDSHGAGAEASQMGQDAK